MKPEAGAVLVLMLFVFCFLFIGGLAAVNAARAAYLETRAQTVADAVALSAVRIRAESLETVAQRWLDIGARTGGVIAEKTVAVSASNRDALLKAAADLKKALPGYKGRSTAVITVTADANDVPREAVAVTDNAGSQLGLVAKDGFLRDENGLVLAVPGLWHERTWATGDRLGNPTEKESVTVRLSSVVRSSSARMAWDVSINDDEIRNVGNGGYPRGWSEAVLAGRLLPNRHAVYRAEWAQ